MFHLENSVTKLVFRNALRQCKIRTLVYARSAVHAIRRSFVSRSLLSNSRVSLRDFYACFRLDSTIVLDYVLC